eukprot:TRINITY_DN7802_c0_g1_i1.p1 TRINITY_DN7802_c0_g1~~TRINITY_DN7802_c0_g1_i1.p1  ORF type:complete len:596 (+),score=68.73 TRINITY_DN7802_c0_g1_i1:215-2002(+)
MACTEQQLPTSGVIKNSEIQKGKNMDRQKMFQSAPLPDKPVGFSVKAIQQEVLEKYFSEHSTIYQQLNQEKSSGWSSESLDGVFNKFKIRLPTNIQQKETQEMQAIMKAVMLEVDSQNGYPIKYTCGQFLDVCCAPGGFTDYVLSTATDAVGMGVTMPYKDGGHAMQVPNSKRFWCHYSNIIDDPKSVIFCKPFYRPPFVPPSYQHSQTPRGHTPRPNSNARGCYPIMNACDIVILDGHYLTPPDKLRAYHQSLKFQSLNNLPEATEGELAKVSEHQTQMGELASGFGVAPMPQMGELTMNFGGKRADLPSPSTPLTQLEFPSSLTIPEESSFHSRGGNEDSAYLSQIDSPQQKFRVNRGKLEDSASFEQGVQHSGGKYSAIMPSGVFPSGFLEGAPGAEEMAFETIRTQNSLWIAQLIIAIRNLREGGTLIMRGTTKPDQFLQALLCLTSRIFKGQLRATKPTVSHMMRSQFYVVCRDFDLQFAKKINLVSRLEVALARVKEATTDAQLMWPFLEGMQEFSTREIFIHTWGPSLKTFLEPLWEFQALALSAMVKNGDKGKQQGTKDKLKVCFYHKLGTCRRNRHRWAGRAYQGA